MRTFFRLIFISVAFGLSVFGQYDSVSRDTSAASFSQSDKPVPTDTLLIEGAAELIRSAGESFFDAMVPGGGLLTAFNADLQKQSEAGIQESDSPRRIFLYPFFNPDVVNADPNAGYLLTKGAAVDYTQTLTIVSGYQISTKLDENGRYLFEEKLGGRGKVRVRQTLVMAREEFIAYNLKNQLRNKFTKAVLAAIATQDEQKSGAVRLFTASVTTNETFQKIFGGDEVAVDATGNINLNLSGSKETSSAQNVSTGKNTQFTPKFEQKQKFLLRGTIGKKVEILFDQDSEREFNFENSIRVTYTGFDDEILQKLEAGNIDLSLPATEFVTQGGQNKGLFGVKTQFKLANLNLTAIASIQQGEKQVIEFKAGSGTTSKITLSEWQYTKSRFFFVDMFYRNHFEEYSVNRLHQYFGEEIIDLRVFVAKDGNQNTPPSFEGVATNNNTLLTDPNLANLSVQAIIDSSTNYETGYFKELSRDQFNYDPKLGILYLNSQLSTGEVLGIWYRTANAVYGNVSSAILKLKLLWRKNPLPSDSTWNLELKNVYDFGTTGLTNEDGKTVKISYKAKNLQIVNSINIGGTNRGTLQLLHVDEVTESGLGQDNVIDVLGNAGHYGLDLNNGYILFPRLRPFDPPTSDLPGFGTELFPASNDAFGDVIRFPGIYDLDRGDINQNTFRSNSRFTLELTSSKRSSTISLGINILEGSEVIRVNGQQLVKDIGYTIDYFSGTIELIDPQTKVPSADIKIEYEQAQLFQIDKKSIFGARAEYSLNDYGFAGNSFIGTTALFHSQSTINRRVQLNEEPFNNFIWDVNTNLEWEANYLTKLVNAIPLVSASQPSKINFGAEYAKLIPTPNTSNGLIRENENGVAYIDDFEAIKRTYPMGTSRRAWTLSSRPLDRLSTNRGYLIWYQRQIDRQEISLIPTANTDNATTLTLALMPRSDGFGFYNSWGGIMRSFSQSGAKELAQSRFIEFWFKNMSLNEKAIKIHIELGEMSEDQNGDFNLQREVASALQIGIEQSQDIGLDGLNDQQEDSLLSRLGIPSSSYGSLTPQQIHVIDSLRIFFPWGEIARSPSDPFGDNWSASQADVRKIETIDEAVQAGEIRDFKVNGSEDNAGKRNQNADGLIISGDTEDLNANGLLDTRNSYLRYTVSTDTNFIDKSILVGRGKKRGSDEENGWLLYRIPILNPDTIIGETDIQKVLQKFLNARIWISPEDNNGDLLSLQIAEFQLVNSEWTFPLQVTNAVIIDSTLTPIPQNQLRGIVEISSVSTDENSNYRRPNNVKKEKPLDQSGSSQRREIKEQSLMLRLKGLPPRAQAIIVKNIPRSDFRNYGQLRMFAHGDLNGNLTLPSSLAETEDSPIRYFIRFGDRFDNYYEIEQPLYADWGEPKNNTDIDLRKDMTSRKFDSSVEPDPVTNIRTFFIEDNKIIRIKGSPSLDNVTQIYLGAFNTDSLQAYQGDVWFDELRLSDAEDTPGDAAKARLSFNFSDLASLNGYVQYQSANFHRVEERFNANNGNTRSWGINGSVNLQKIYIERFGISLPVSFSLNQNVTEPKYLPNNDILVSIAKSQNDSNIAFRESQFNTIRDSLQILRGSGADTSLINAYVRDSIVVDSLLSYFNTFDDRIRTQTLTRGFNVSFSKARNDKDFWLIRWTVNNITSNFSYNWSEQKNPQYASRQDQNWNSTTSYTLAFPRKTYRILGWMPFVKTPFIGNVFRNLGETDLNYSLITATTTNFTINSTLSEVVERDAVGRPIQKPKVSTLTATRSYGLTASPWQSLSANLNVSYSSDLRGLSAFDILKGVGRGLNPLNGFDDFVYGSAIDTIRGRQLADSLVFNRDYGASNTFTITYTPATFPFLNHSISYNANTQSTRRKPVQSEFNQNVTLSRRVQIDLSFSLRNFIGNIKEPFKTPGGSRGEDRTRSRRDRFKTPTTEPKSESPSDSTEESSSGFSVLEATRKAGSVIEAALATINDTRFTIGFDNRYNFQGLTRPLDGSATWFGYTNTRGNGLIENIFSFDLDTIRQYSGIYDRQGQTVFSLTKGINYAYVYGFNFNYFTVDLRYDHAENRALATNNQESITIQESNRFPLLAAVPFPFYDITIRANNIGRWPIFNLLAGITKNMGFGTSYVSKSNRSFSQFDKTKPSTFNGIVFRDGDGNVDSAKTYRRVNGRDIFVASIGKSTTFPQINFDIEWLGNITQSIAFTNVVNETRSATLKTNGSIQTINSSVSYVKRGGFRIPFWFLKNKKLENEIRFASTFSWRQSKNYNQTLNGPRQKMEDTFSWSTEPRIDYSFTKWITGGTFFRYEKTKTLTTTISRVLFGLNVNITIGA